MVCLNSLPGCKDTAVCGIHRIGRYLYMAEDMNALSLDVTWIIRFLLRMFNFVLLEVDGDLTADRSRLLSRPLVHFLTAQ